MLTVTYDGSGTLAGIKIYLNEDLQSCDPYLLSLGFQIDTLGGNTIVSPVETGLGDLKNFTNPDGSQPAINHYFFKGGISSIGVWTTAISQTCINWLYAAGKTGNPANSPCAANLTSGYSFKYESFKDDIGANDGTSTDIIFSLP